MNRRLNAYELAETVHEALILGTGALKDRLFIALALLLPYSDTDYFKDHLELQRRLRGLAPFHPRVTEGLGIAEISELATLITAWVRDLRSESS